MTEIVTHWQQRIAAECSGQNATNQASILDWLLGKDRERLETLDTERLKTLDRGMDYRLWILTERYLGFTPHQAYQNLMHRLRSVTILREKIRSWLRLSNDCQRTVIDVLQETIQELLRGDKYIQQQIAQIGEYTRNRLLRDTLLFASIEEYCLRSIRNLPLIAYRFINYLRHSQTGGVINIPQGQIVKLISDDLFVGDSDSKLSLFDRQARDNYQQQQEWEATQVIRDRVKQTLRSYLVEKLGAKTGRWLDLYLQGKTPEAIAIALEMEVDRVYRLREKVIYHAIDVFAVKAEPELVSQWLHISVSEHNFGFTPKQWDKFDASLDANQRAILAELKAGTSIEAIAKLRQTTINRVICEWRKLYLAAQAIRAI